MRKLSGHTMSDRLVWPISSANSNDDCHPLVRSGPANREHWWRLLLIDMVYFRFLSVTRADFSAHNHAPLRRRARAMRTLFLVFPHVPVTA